MFGVFVLRAKSNHYRAGKIIPPPKKSSPALLSAPSLGAGLPDQVPFRPRPFQEFVRLTRTNRGIGPSWEETGLKEPRILALALYGSKRLRG